MIINKVNKKLRLNQHRVMLTFIARFPLLTHSLFPKQVQHIEIHSLDFPLLYNTSLPNPSIVMTGRSDTLQQISSQAISKKLM